MSDLIEVQCVTGGFIMSTRGGESTTEVFTSPGKLMKVLRTWVDAHSKKDEDEGAPETSVKQKPVKDYD